MKTYNEFKSINEANKSFKKDLFNELKKLWEKSPEDALNYWTEYINAAGKFFKSTKWTSKQFDRMIKNMDKDKNWNGDVEAWYTIQRVYNDNEEKPV